MEVKYKMMNLFCKHQVAISAVAALMLFGLCAASSVASANQDLNEYQVYPKEAKFRMACGDRVAVRDWLLAKYNEVGAIAGFLDDGTQYVFYVNDANTSMSIVVHKNNEACVIWNGTSQKGRAFVANPNTHEPESGEKAYND
jgi:hypothetical protein